MRLHQLTASLRAALCRRLCSRGSAEQLNDSSDDNVILCAPFDGPRAAWLPAGPVGDVYLAQQREIEDLKQQLAARQERN